MRRWIFALFSGLGLLWGVALDAQDPNPRKTDGRQAFEVCTTCHGRPDPALRSGTLWIGRVQETACVQPLGPKSDRLRKALQDYLMSTHDVPGQEAEARDAGTEEGLISLGHSEVISVLLTPASGGSPVRLVWARNQGSESRALPAGKYRVQQYAVTRRDRGKLEWQLWASGAKGRTIEVKRGERTKLELDPRVNIRSMARFTKRGLQVTIAPTGDHHMGVTIVKNGTRVPAEYQLVGPTKALATGALSYG